MNANQHKLIAVLSLCTTAAIPNIASAIAVSGQGTWETTLQGRDLDGNLATFEAYYDTALNITWLADANYGAGSTYDNIGNTDFHDDTTTDGRMTWANANAWATSLNLYGITGWRLPAVTDPSFPDCPSYNGSNCGYNVDTTTSEMAHLFYITLGNKAYYDTAGTGPQTGWGLTNTGEFSNIQTGVDSPYWSNSEIAPSNLAVWDFDFGYGGQLGGDKDQGYYAWAVHAGDVGAAPIPAAAWLFGSGLIGLAGVTRRPRRQNRDNS